MNIGGEKGPLRAGLISIPAALGLIFCSLNAAGADLLCLTSGCSLYAGYAIGGISIHALGAVGFGVILVLSLAESQGAVFRRLLFGVLLAGLLIDTLFLVWQILYWPCTSCLVVALLLALCVLGALKTIPSFRVRSVRFALLVWFAAFVPVATAAAKEILLQPWPVLGSPEAPVAVYFSPSCPTCEETVLEILDLSELTGQVAFYPLAKGEEDMRRLARMKANEGRADLAALFSPVAGSVSESDWMLRWRMARNKMALARLGSDKVPFVTTPRLVQAAPAMGLPLGEGGGFPLNLYDISPLDEGCSADAPVEKTCE